MLEGMASQIYHQFVFNGGDKKRIDGGRWDIKKQAYTLLMCTSLLKYINWEAYNN